MQIIPPGSESLNLMRALETIERVEADPAKTKEEKSRDELHAAIHTIAKYAIAHLPQESSENLKVAKTKLKSLIASGLATDEALFAIKCLDVKVPISESILVEQSYYVTAILESIMNLKERFPKIAKTLSIADFTDHFCSFVFNHSSKSSYLVRANSSLQDGKYNGKECMFYTLTRPRKDNQDLIHMRIAHVEDPQTNKVYWCPISLENKTPIFKSDIQVDNLEKLIVKLIGDEFQPAPEISKKEMNFFICQCKFVEKTFNEDKIVQSLLDPISFQLFKNPVITPEGQTFSKGGLLRSLAIKKQNPLTRTALDQNTIRDNCLVEELVELALEAIGAPDQNKRFKQKFLDPISKKMMAKLVVAPDGKTYDKDTLLSYLDGHDATLPGSSVKCREEELIPNLMAQQILDFIQN